jgi:hypothetical protein
LNISWKLKKKMAKLSCCRVSVLQVSITDRLFKSSIKRRKKKCNLYHFLGHQAQLKKSSLLWNLAVKNHSRPAMVKIFRNTWAHPWIKPLPYDKLLSSAFLHNSAEYLEQSNQFTSPCLFCGDACCRRRLPLDAAGDACHTKYSPFN